MAAGFFLKKYEITRAKQFGFSILSTVDKNALVVLIGHVVNFEDDLYPTRMKKKCISDCNIIVRKISQIHKFWKIVMYVPQ